MKSYFDSLFSIAHNNSPLEQIALVEIYSKMVNDYLLVDDRMSMAHSVELRVPFLDKDLVEYMFTIPGKIKIKHNVTKYLFRLAMKPYLPKKIIEKRKWGFTVNSFEQFKKDLKFVAFDVKIGDNWLDVPNAESIVQSLGLDFVWYIKCDTNIDKLNEYRDNLQEKFIRFFDNQQQSLDLFVDANRTRREAIDDQRRNLDIKFEELGTGIDTAAETLTTNINTNTGNVTTSVKQILKDVDDVIKTIK